MLRVRNAALVAAMMMVGLAAAASAQGAVAKETTAASGEVKVNEFMTYDAAAKTTHVHLSAALGSANGGMNFNGGARGDQTITVPQGWHVIMDFENKDAIPHSAIIIPDKFPLPAQPQDPAIPRAYTNDVTAGLPTGGTDTMDFKAAKAGDYLIACGVPGHAPSGMYIKFVVSATASTPNYAMKK
ncbi:MAG TPA: sulfocyanin-like copper-binding protein [Gemmatimonadaceae bacterium]|nr:sulfocyanin-like copper-binding protein [Gemmatimonadaceae bacterium]